MDATAAALMQSASQLSLARLEDIARRGEAPVLAAADRQRIEAARGVVEHAVAEGRRAYGITTGFGSLARIAIDPAQTAQLQLNLIRSHAVGFGDPLPTEVVRAMLSLLVASLARGHSGVRVEVVELLAAMLERDVVPVIPAKGSMGSSGDLAPLAHLALVLVGEGEATVAGERRPGAQALSEAGLEPVTLTAKEGLALINGTHLMAAVGTLAVRDAQRLLAAGTVACALSVESFKGSTVPFDARIHELRGQPGQVRVAARLRALLDGSAIVASHSDCGRVQDPYTLRCAPQVLGAVSDAIDYVSDAVARELSAVTDNPLVFPEDGAVMSAGNFHGQPLSLPLDHLALALCELASFSERRVFALLAPSSVDLPPYLSPEPGLGSGLMIAQYVAASLVNECQVLSHPAGAGSIPTSAGQEDFNSMGAWAALKARTVTENAARVVATELVCACQAIEFHRPLRTTAALEAVLADVRSYVPRVERDRSLAAELDALADAIRTGELAMPA
ncbi:MAG TPA: histidine ammonia-lyase [Conexibacter sp.]|nr:histidine ammonia-lyase [Conexibacter sp.]